MIMNKIYNSITECLCCLFWQQNETTHQQKILHANALQVIPKRRLQKVCMYLYNLTSRHQRLEHHDTAVNSSVSTQCAVLSTVRHDRMGPFDTPAIRVSVSQFQQHALGASFLISDPSNHLLPTFQLRIYFEENKRSKSRLT